MAAVVGTSPVYRYFFTDLLTNAMIGGMELSNVSWTSALSVPGSFSAEINIADVRRRNSVNLSSFIQPGRTSYWVDRNGVLVAGGIIWDDEYDQESRTYKMTGATFDSYVDHVIINQLLVYTGMDTCTIAIDLWNHAQGGVDGSNIGLVIPVSGSVLSGSVESDAWDPSMVATYGSAIQQLSRQTPGFDYYVGVSYDANRNPTKSLVMGGPYVGAPSSTTGLVFRKPGNILSYRWPRFGSQSPNKLYGVGGGIGTGSLTSTYTNQAMISAGYPILAAPMTFKDVFDPTILTSLTNAYGTALSSGVVTPTIRLSPNAKGASVGSFNPGDACRVVIEPDEYFANGLDTYMRISSITGNPASAGQTEDIVLTLSQAVT